MKWITQKQVKAAAKTEKTAKICSELHWWQLWNCTEAEFKKKVRQYKGGNDNNTIISTVFCAFCARHNNFCCNKEERCLLKGGMGYCCEEYSDAKNAYYNWLEDKTPSNFGCFLECAKVIWRKIKNLKL